ncbi:MAG: Wzz/FepE/Etk N-terminal domain-containing protein, partial [Candidatus Deferrimicrobiaceae bacterium]
MPLRPDMELHDYFQIFLARKWIVVLAYIVVFLSAVVYIAGTPKQYLSATTIMTIPEQVPENFVQSTVTLEPEGRLSTIQQVITSRTRLKKV